MRLSACFFFRQQGIHPVGTEYRLSMEKVKPKEVNLDEKHLSKLIEGIRDSTFYSVDGIIVVKSGKIVLEEYFNGFTKDSLHNVTSVGKSLHLL